MAKHVQVGWYCSRCGGFIRHKRSRTELLICSCEDMQSATDSSIRKRHLEWLPLEVQTKFPDKGRVVL